MRSVAIVLGKQRVCQLEREEEAQILPQPHMKNVGQQLTSGAASGFASTIVLQPFDLLKTRLQQRDSLLDHQRPSIYRTARGIVQANGLLGLWRGTSPSLIRNVPGVALYMTGLTQLRTFMASSPYFARVKVMSEDTKHSSVLPKLTSQGNLISGAVARVAVGFVMNPFSVLKARFESNIYAYETVSGAFVSIVRLGPSELLKGFTATSLRDAPYAGLFVAFYEAFKKQAATIVPPTSNSQSTLIHSVSAASAGALATMATHPFDVIKTKLQVRNEDRYQGFLRTVNTIWKHQGLAGYFEGASLRLSRKVLSSAIGWAVYECILMLIRT